MTEIRIGKSLYAILLLALLACLYFATLLPNSQPIIDENRLAVNHPVTPITKLRESKPTSPALLTDNNPFFREPNRIIQTKPDSSPVPPRIQPVLAPTVPHAPPVPFIYLGRLQDENNELIFLKMGDKNYAIKTGDIIDNIYKVIDINSDKIKFIYIPLNENQDLYIR